MKGDGRSGRAAIVSDALLNPPPGAPDVLDALADAGWGVIALPPTVLGEPEFGDWVDGAADQARELRRHGMTVVAVVDADDERARTALERSLSAAPALSLPLLVTPASEGEAIAAFLERHRVVGGSGWLDEGVTSVSPPGTV